MLIDCVREELGQAAAFGTFHRNGSVASKSRVTRGFQTMLDLPRELSMWYWTILYRQSCVKGRPPRVRHQPACRSAHHRRWAAGIGERAGSPGVESDHAYLA